MESLVDAVTLPPFDEAIVARQGADAHRIRFDQAGRPQARCSLWWQTVPSVPGKKLGLIGHFAAQTSDDAIALLNDAGRELAAHGCTHAVGPMDGSTWRHYRFITERGNEPTFFLEPDQPDPWPHYFERAGFAPLAHYQSTVAERLDYEDPKSLHAEQILTRLGVTLRPLNADRLDDELGEFYQLTLAAFAKAFLYQPLPEAAFRADFSRLRPILRPELVLIAMHAGRAIGYVFNLPDIAAVQRGQPVDTVILKTLAIVPDRTYAGLGRWLTQQTHRTAHQLGYRRVIHALMQDGNPSLSLSARFARPIRRYTLFSRPLTVVG